MRETIVQELASVPGDSWFQDANNISAVADAEIRRILPSGALGVVRGPLELPQPAFLKTGPPVHLRPHPAYSSCPRAQSYPAGGRSVLVVAPQSIPFPARGPKDTDCCLMATTFKTDGKEEEVPRSLVHRWEWKRSRSSRR
jgi:hypothetical protein